MNPHDEPQVTYQRVELPATAREGERLYSVFVDGVEAGRVRRYRERYPGPKIGRNVVTRFIQCWTWKAEWDGRSGPGCSTRKDAVLALLRR